LLIIWHVQIVKGLVSHEAGKMFGLGVFFVRREVVVASRHGLVEVELISISVVLGRKEGSVLVKVFLIWALLQLLHQTV
jgi:hypothetical protein